MSAILLAFSLWFQAPQSGDLVLMDGNKVIAVISDFRKLKIVRWGTDPEVPQEVICECIDDYEQRPAKKEQRF